MSGLWTILTYEHALIKNHLIVALYCMFRADIFSVGKRLSPTQVFKKFSFQNVVLFIF